MSTKRNYLAFDTSGPFLTVALKSGSAPVKERKIAGFLNHSTHLLPVIDRLLKSARLKLPQIDAFLINRGPGSFTGLRIGFATLKGLVAVTKKACFGGMSLDIIAENVTAPETSHLCVALDARRNAFYASFYQRRKSSWMPITELRVYSFEELIRSLPAHCLLTGDMVRRHAETIQKQAGSEKQIVLLPEKFLYPKASTLIRWLEEKSADPKRKTPLKRLTKAIEFLPLYQRRSEAEEKQDAYAVNSVRIPS